MQITFLGGAHEVGASCAYVELDGKKLVLDCGMLMGKVKDTMPDLRLLQEKGGVDAIFFMLIWIIVGIYPYCQESTH